MKTLPKLSVVIPMYYEEDVAYECYTRIKKMCDLLLEYTYEIIFVDDGSKDMTGHILENISHKDKNVKVITFSRNFGHQAAVTAGLKYVSGDVIAIIDADLQDPPELIPQMLSLWEKGNDVIYGKRKSREGESYFKLLTARMFYKTISSLSDFEIPQDTGDFRVVDRCVIDIVNSLPEHNKFLRGLFSWVGYNQTSVEYERKKRFAGKTKYPLRKMLKLAFDGIFSFSAKPLKLIGGLGIVTFFISLCILVYSLISFIAFPQNIAPGWTSIMVTLTLLGSVILLSLWIVAEYIARIYDETKNRPQYIIKQTCNIGNKEKTNLFNSQN